MPDALKSLAVRHVKPHVPADAWQRLRRAGSARPVSSLREARRLRAMNLTELAQEFKTDKWGHHRYTPHYQRHLEHLRNERFTLLELGIGGYWRDGSGGASLRMWKHFFPKATIVGLDIHDKSFVDQERIVTYRGSQDDPEVLARIVREQGLPRVVIDDGSHRSPHILKSFEILFPQLPMDAIYVIEDTQTSYWPDWDGSLDLDAKETSMGMVKGFVDGLNHEEFLGDDHKATYADQHIVGLHCYHNLVFMEKGLNNEGSAFKVAANARFYGRK